MVKVAFIGLGSMGSMLVKGFIASGGLAPAEIVLSTRTKSKLEDARAMWKDIQTVRSNREAVAMARHVFLCVKPADVRAILAEILPSVATGTHIISIAGSVSMANIEGITGGAVTKVIPTVTSEVGGGVSLYCHNAAVLPEDAAFIEGLLQGVGKIKMLPECEFGLATELTSCMPGFIAAIFEQVVEAALCHTDTMSRADAEELVRQTLLGTARLLVEEDMGFAGAIERVATIGGITEEGVKVLRAGLPAVLDEMFDKTMEKRQLVQERLNGPTNG